MTANDKLAIVRATSMIEGALMMINNQYDFAFIFDQLEIIDNILAKE